MNTRIVLLAVSATLFSSCSTMYKSGQTPDDVYYSPNRESAAIAKVDDNRNEEDGYVDVNDRYLRMKASSRSRWSSFDDDMMYWNDPRWNSQIMYGMGIGMPFNTFGAYGWGSMGWTSLGWNRPFWNNPFCPVFYGNPVVVVGKPGINSPRNYGPRTYNLNTYTSPSQNMKSIRTYNSSVSRNGNAPVRVFSNRGNVGSANSDRRSTYSGYESTNEGRSYNNSGSGNRQEYRSAPTRSFDSNRSSGSSGSGTRSSAPVRTFSRGGGQ